MKKHWNKGLIPFFFVRGKDSASVFSGHYPSAKGWPASKRVRDAAHDCGVLFGVPVKMMIGCPVIQNRKQDKRLQVVEV